MRLLVAGLLIVLSLLPLNPVAAHEANDSFIKLSETNAGFQVTWEVSISDLDFLIGLDHDLDGNITRQDLASMKAAIEEAMLPSLSVSAAGQQCRFENTEIKVAERASAPYLSLLFSANCPAGTNSVVVGYEFMFESDLSHKSIVQLSRPDQSSALVASPANRILAFDDPSASGWLRTSGDFYVSGINHIFEGYDHIAFLLVLIFGLLLTAHRQATPGKSVLVEAIKTLTAFTVAHAVTITLAQLELVPIAGWIVESAIALSIIIAVIDSFWSFLGQRKWLIGFVFGLIHGVGFAGALGSVGLEGASLVAALVGFNAGIETGQLLLAGFTILLFWAARTKPRFQEHALVTGLSTAFLLGVYWFWERVSGSGIWL